MIIIRIYEKYFEITFWETILLKNLKIKRKQKDGR